jgi:hypothetical protein
VAKRDVLTTRRPSLRSATDFTAYAVPGSSRPLASQPVPSSLSAPASVPAADVTVTLRSVPPLATTSSRWSTATSRPRRLVMILTGSTTSSPA